MQLLVYPITVFVWFTGSVNHTTSWSKILIPGWICLSEQSACHVVYYCRRQVPVYAQLSYLSFKASESDHFAMVAVTRCRKIVFLSSFSFIFVTQISHTSFPTVGLSSKCGLQHGVGSHRPTYHGLDLQCRSRHLETQESLLTLCVVTFHVSHLLEHFLS